MRYVVEPGQVRVAGQHGDELDATVVLVGCGGTGGFLAEALARLLLGRRIALFLVDPDRVGPENLRRQDVLRGIRGAGRMGWEVFGGEEWSHKQSRERGVGSGSTWRA